jgi:AraC family transcriptional regulator
LLSPLLLSRWQGLPLAWFTTPAGTWIDRFAAPHTALALLDTGGLRARFHIGRRHHDLEVRPGGFGLFGAGVEAGVEQLGAFDARRILLELDTNALVSRGLCDDDLAPALHHSQFFEDPELAAVLRRMVDEVRQGCPNGALFAESLSLGVVLHLHRTRTVVPAGARERGKLSQRQWARLEERIDQALASDLTLAALSAAVGLSKPQFVRLFRNTTGTSPHRYVMRKRAERALQLVQCSDLSLVDIAFDVGFANQGHLNRVFHRLYGLTPGEARRSKGR